MLTRAGTCAVLVLVGSALQANAADPPPAKPPSGDAKSLTVFPAEASLNGPRDSQRLLIVGEYPDGRKWDLSRDAKCSSSAADIVAVDATGVLRPVGDGQATITVQAGGQSATVAVRVQGAKTDVPVSFSREVAPILTKFGCNQGACHGAQHGRGGFKLSLLGFDPLFDHPEIVQSAKGRRVVVSDPERSILLQKPAGVMEHGGGERLPLGGFAYARIKQWLADGAPEPKANDSAVTRLEIFPARRVMVPGEQQQLGIRAVWTDGKTEDVTATTQFDSLRNRHAITSRFCGF